MKILPTGLQAHLDSGVTTLCQCWRLTLKSGAKLGFTDHDRTLTFDGTNFEAQAGFTGSEIESFLGLSVDNLEANGALTSGVLDEARLRAGDFDHAAIEIWRVNWQDVAQRLLMRADHLGEVSFGGGAFTAEVRGLAHVLNQQQGRVYQHGCDAMLGDGRCKVVASGFAVTRSVMSASGSAVTVGSVTQDDDWFSRGTIEFLAGAGTGRVFSIRRHRKVGATAVLDLWQQPEFTITPGTSVKLTAGCDKQFATCHEKFSNAVNYRGFPHMPGSDFVTSFPHQGDPLNDGSRRD